MSQQLQPTGPAVGLTVTEAAERVLDDPDSERGPILLPDPILKPPGVRGASGFFDPDDPTSADGTQSIRMCRLVEGGHETFRLDEPIGYWDVEVGAVLVPGNKAVFRTDLTSVPRYFGWLVTTTGTHLPAALLHDGLTPDAENPATYVANHPIDRPAADRIFRSALRDLGTSWALRWLVWTGVTIATMVTGPVRQAWRSILAVAATVLAVLVGGTLATLDVIDCRAPLPWMADRPVAVELLAGALGAVVVPAVLSLLWGARWRAGVIAGVALALLVHVTLAVVVVYGVFGTLDALTAARQERVVDRLLAALRSATMAVVPTAAIVAIALWGC
ncbi:MAG TPA: DUF1353 domain-containing protein [Acidimicrobiales bacterium]